MRALAAFLKSQKLILYDRSSPTKGGTKDGAGEFSVALADPEGKTMPPQVTATKNIKTEETHRLYVRGLLIISCCTIHNLQQSTDTIPYRILVA
jgi:hypothetical protein